MARYRLVHVGMAALLSAGVMTTVGVAQSVLARPSLGTASSFVPIKPCRLMDTRPSSTVGQRSTPIGAAETTTVAVWGEQGDCFIPDNATGIAVNVTAVNPTAASHLTVFPAEGARPRTSNLNWRAGSQPVANHVAVGLPAAELILNINRTDIVLVDGLPTVPGAIRVYNFDGTVDVVIDITGYYEPALAGPQGVPGEPGKDGQPGVGDLGCTAGQTATWNDLESVWVCSDPVVDTDSDTLAGLECQASSIPFYDGEGWSCTDRVPDSDTLALLGTRCNAEMTVKWNGEAWVCVDPVVDTDTDTLAGLECTIDQLIKWNGEAWVCVDPAVDTLAALACTVNQSVRWNGEAWECRNEPIVATLSRAAFGPPCCGIPDMFEAYSPNVDTGPPFHCDVFLCQISLVDVVDHTSCQVSFSGNSQTDLLDVVKLPDHIDVWNLDAADGAPLYVNISCNT